MCGGSAGGPCLPVYLLAFLRASDARTRTRRLFDALIGLSFSTDSPLTLFLRWYPSLLTLFLLPSFPFSSFPFLPFRSLLHAQYALQQSRSPPSTPPCPSALPFLRLGHDRPSEPAHTRVCLRLRPKRSRPSPCRHTDANTGANAPPCVLRLALPPLHQVALTATTASGFGTCVGARVHGNGGLSLSRPANAAVRPVASGPHARKIQNRNGCFTSRFSFSCENEASEICASGFASGVWPLQGQQASPCCLTDLMSTMGNLPPLTACLFWFCSYIGFDLSTPCAHTYS